MTELRDTDLRVVNCRKCGRSFEARHADVVAGLESARYCTHEQCVALRLKIVRKRKRVTHLNSAGYETKRKNKASTNKKGAKRAKRQDVPEPLYRDHRDQEMNTVRTGARGLLAARNEDAYNKLANLLQQMMDD